MSNFSYEPPDAQRYMKAVLRMLNGRGKTELYNKLKNAACSIHHTSDYSHQRWNAYRTTVVFELPMLDFSNFELDDEVYHELISICSIVMPPQVGFDVMHIEFTPSLNELYEQNSLESELNEIATNISHKVSPFNLPLDILDSGRRMAEVYLYLYAVENYLRLFIERVAVSTHGVHYFAKLAIPRNIANTIASRKEREKKNQWISVRGNSDLFYLDFKDLGDIITNNWLMFQDYLPSQTWIISKIDDLYACRNLVAHNSLIGDHEINVIRTNFGSILRQLNP